MTSQNRANCSSPKRRKPLDCYYLPLSSVHVLTSLFLLSASSNDPLSVVFILSVFLSTVLTLDQAESGG